MSLNYQMWEVTQKPAVQKEVAAFEKQNPNIDVKITITPWADYWTKLQTTATSGTAPDVFWMNTPNLPKYAHGGVLLPLNDYISQNNVAMKSYAPATVQSATWNGKIYGIPKDVDSLALWYNKQLFQDAGVPLPTNNWTWADMVAAAQKLTNPAKHLYGIPALPTDQLSYYNTIPQAGGHVISADDKKSGYSDPASIKGLQLWVDLIQKYHVSPTLQQMTDTDPTNMFQSGKLAMTFAGTWLIPTLTADPSFAQNLGVVSMPLVTKRSGVSNSLANVVYAKSKHPAEAEKLAAFLGSAAAQGIQAKSGVVPALTSAQQTWAKSLPAGIDGKVFIATIAHNTPFPRSLDSAVWETIATNEFAKAWAGTESVADAAKSVAQQMNTALAAEPK